MFMDAGLDTGDMLLRSEMDIGPDMTLEELHDALRDKGAQLLADTLEKLSDGTLVRIPQQGDSNYAPMLTKQTGHIDWSQKAEAIHNLVRGLNSWPGAYTVLEKSGGPERPEQRQKPRREPSSGRTGKADCWLLRETNFWRSQSFRRRAGKRCGRQII